MILNIWALSTEKNNMTSCKENINVKIKSKCSDNGDLVRYVPFFLMSCKSFAYVILVI